MNSIHPAGWIEIDSQDNSLATATRAAEPGKNHIIYSVDASFSAATAFKLLQIKEATTVIWEGYVSDSREVTFPRGLKITEGVVCSAELAASGTAAVIGKVNLHGAST